MNRFNCLRECAIDALEWNESADESGDDDDDDDDDDDSAPCSDEAMSEPGDSTDSDAGVPDVAELELSDAEPGMEPTDAGAGAAFRHEATAFMGVSKDPNRTEEDVLSTPAPGEVLQTFYLRTKQYWASRAFQKSEGESRGKQLRRDGFDVRH